MPLLALALIFGVALAVIHTEHRRSYRLVVDALETLLQERERDS